MAVDIFPNVASTTVSSVAPSNPALLTSAVVSATEAALTSASFSHAAGGLIVVMASLYTPSSAGATTLAISDTMGGLTWTQVTANKGAVGNETIASIFYAISNGNAGTVTVTPSRTGAATSGMTLSIYGVTGQSAVNATGTSTGSATVTMTSQPGAGSLVMGLLANGLGSDPANTIPAGTTSLFTDRHTGSNTYDTGVYDNQSASQSLVFGGTVTNAAAVAIEITQVLHSVVAAGTVELWNVASSAPFFDAYGLTAATGFRQFRVIDPADTQSPPEVILVTNVNGPTWTVKRGAEIGAPTAHGTSGGSFTVTAVATAGGLANAVTQVPDGIIPATTGGIGDKVRNLYAPYGVNLVKTRARLAATAAGTARTKIAVIGASNVAGYNGSASVRGVSDYPYELNSILGALGYPCGEPALVINDWIAGDLRATVTGVWTPTTQPSAAMYSLIPNGGTLDFPGGSGAGTDPGTARGRSTNALFILASAAGGAFSIKVDGLIPNVASAQLPAGATVTVSAHGSYNTGTGVITPDGTSNFITVTVTGLPMRAHALLITATTANACIFMAEFYRTNGVSVANFGSSSSRTSHWADTSFWANLLNVVLAWGPDMVILDAGIATNDYTNGVALTATSGNLFTIANALQGAGIEVVLNTPPPFITAVPGFWQNFFTLADYNGIQVIDNNARWVTQASALALGLYGSDNFHPSEAGYQDVARSVASALELAPRSEVSTISLESLQNDTGMALRRAGAIAESVPRSTVVTATLASAATGVLYAVAVGLGVGQVITSITFLSGTTAGGTLTHQWFALLDHTGKVLAVTNDVTSAAWNASAEKTLNLSAPYTVTYSGVYYLAKLVTATTVPTMAGSALTAGVAVSTGLPMPAATAGSGLTTPSSVGTIFTLATSVNLAYAYAG